MTNEQRAVIAACKARYVEVQEAAEVPPPLPEVRIVVKDKKGYIVPLWVKPDGTTRAYHFGGVPVRLYGGIPKNPDKLDAWGRGLPKHAKPFLTEDKNVRD